MTDNSVARLLEDTKLLLAARTDEIVKLRAEVSALEAQRNEAMVAIGHWQAGCPCTCSDCESLGAFYCDAFVRWGE